MFAALFIIAGILGLSIVIISICRAFHRKACYKYFHARFPGKIHCRGHRGEDFYILHWPCERRKSAFAYGPWLLYCDNAVLLVLFVRYLRRHGVDVPLCKEEQEKKQKTHGSDVQAYLTHRDLSGYIDTDEFSVLYNQALKDVLKVSAIS